MRAREAAVYSIAAGVTVYELLCKDGETISEYFDSHMEKRWKQALLLGGGAVMLAHVANLFDEANDPFERTLSPVRQFIKRRTA